MKNVQSEHLSHPLEQHDHRVIEHQRKVEKRALHYNRLYDSLRTEQAWRYISDAYAAGTFTTVANATVNTAISLKSVPFWRLEQWPGAVQVYLVLRFFTLAPQSAITAVGAIDALFIDKYGNTAPLGDFVSNAAGSSNLHALLPSSIVDPSDQQVGTLSVTLTGTTPTVSAYNYQIGFSAAYLLPAPQEKEHDPGIVSSSLQSSYHPYHTVDAPHSEV